MSNNNLSQTIEGIGNSLTLYTESLDQLRSYLNKLEQLDKFYKTIDEDFNINDISGFKSQLDFTGFLTISILDLLVISKNILASTYVWERVHQLKLGYLVIYGAIKTYHNHTEINALAKSETKSSDLYKLISIELNFFKKEYDYPNIFKEIRNATIAHINADFKIYYDTVKKIDGNKYFEAILSFLQILYKMQELANYLAKALTLQKNGEPFDIDKLMKELSE